MCNPINCFNHRMHFEILKVENACEKIPWCFHKLHSTHYDDNFHSLSSNKFVSVGLLYKIGFPRHTLVTHKVEGVISYNH